MLAGGDTSGGKTLIIQLMLASQERPFAQLRGEVLAAQGLWLSYWLRRYQLP